MSHSHPSVGTFFAVFVALLLLLALTVGVAQMNLGEWNFVAATLIAATKALLIILFFMHVRYSAPLTKIVVCAGFLWLLIMFALTFADYWSRGWLTTAG